MPDEIGDLAAGMGTRLKMARAIAAGTPSAALFHNKKMSLVRDAYLKQYCGVVDYTLSSFFDLQIISIVHRSGTIDRAIQAFDRFGHLAQNKYLEALVLGHRLREPSLASAGIESDLDRSMVGQSLILAERAGHRQLLEAMRKFTSDCYASFGVKHPVTSFASLSKLARPFVGDCQLTNLSDLAALAPRFATSSWFVFGGSFWAALEAVAEGTEHTPSSQRVMETYGLQDLAAAVAQLRARADAVFYPPESPEEVATWEERFSSSQLNQMLTARAPTRSTRSTLDQRFLDIAGEAFEALRFGIHQRRLELCYRVIALLYDLDPWLLRYVDWGQLHERLPAFRENPTIAKCFVDSLFASPEIATKYPFLSIARGDGVFIGSYPRMLEARRSTGKSLSMIVGEIKAELPPRAAQHFCRYLLRADIADTFHLKLPTPPILDETLGDDHRTEYLRAAQRIQLAQHVRRQKLLDEDYCDGIIEEERRNIALVKFRRDLNRGRIRIPQALIHTEVLRFANAIMPQIEFNRQHGDLRDETLATSVVALLRAEIETFVLDILLKLPSSLDKLVSSNIRHGMIADRYQASFLGAVRASDQISKRKFNWEDPVVAGALGDAYEAVSNLKREITAEVQSFVANTLTLHPTDPGVQTLVHEVSEEIVRFLPKMNESVLTLVAGIVKLSKDRISSLLSAMRDEFEHSLSPRVINLAASCREQLKEKNGHTFPWFFDSLDNHLRQTHKDVVSWLRIADERVEYDEFRVTDLALLEADIVHLSGSQDIQIESNCYRRSHGKLEACSAFEIRGRYFPALSEIIHNLMSNALKHSGQGYETRLRIAFIKDGNNFSIECRNSANAERFERFLASYDAVTALASSEDSDMAGKEGKSGFKKIMETGKHYFGVRPLIRIPRPRAKSSQVTIAIELLGVAQDIEVERR